MYHSEQKCAHLRSERYAVPPSPGAPLIVSTGGRFNNAYELLNLRALKISMLYKSHIFQCMGKIFCVEFQRVPLKFHTKYLTHTLKDKSLWNIEILRALRVKSSYAFLKRLPNHVPREAASAAPAEGDIIYQGIAFFRKILSTVFE